MRLAINPFIWTLEGLNVLRHDSLNVPTLSIAVYLNYFSGPGSASVLRQLVTIIDANIIYDYYYYYYYLLQFYLFNILFTTYRDRC